MIPVYVVVYDGVLLLDLVGISEPLRLANQWARSQGRALPFELRFIGPAPRAETSLGLELAGLQPLSARLPRESWLIVPGAADVRRRYAGREAARLVEWLAAVGPQTARRLTVCSGALLAGRAGWLDGRQCTTHHDLIPRLAQLAPSAKVLANRIFVIDGGVATSAGIMAGVDLALWLVGEVLGPIGALAVAREMVVYIRRAGGDPQLSLWLAHRNHLHPAVHRVQDAIALAPTQTWTVPRMAAVAHVGERHLARLFSEHAGVTPLVYLQRIRVALAQTLLGDPDMSVEAAAEKAGFSSAHQLRRVWHRELAATPRRNYSR
jgi:transcriptional regulator GlxA family with amidase domain